jgi:phosphoenolpyruvate---glycerone phosphotransferase subunit DhaL
MSSLNVENVVRIIAETIITHENELSELDGVVGDGDFGFSLARGFEKVLEDFEQLDHSSPGAFLKKVSMTLMGRVGGVSGTIWGTAFLQASLYLGDRSDVSKEDLVGMLHQSIAGIKRRGQSDVGDKTLLDALVPAVDSLEQSFLSGQDGPTALRAAASKARQSAENTRDMLAKRGRAAYAGERSIGSLDAGAVAIALLFEALSKVCI